MTKSVVITTVKYYWYESIDIEQVIKTVEKITEGSLLF